jgi:pimeloyl-ACP methyl ester carboxylesterase
MHTHATAPTRFIDAGGVRYAYRRFGTPSAVPIVLLQHFTGGLDHWDPAFTDGVAASREVILVDNAGVGASSGETPQTIEGMADCIRDFVDALALPSFDLLGFSMGGMVAQAYAKQHADRIRRLVLVGTSPRGGDPTPFGAEVAQRARGNAGEEEMAWLFFGHSDAGRAAAARYWQRRHVRTEDRDPPSEMPTILAQVAAGRDWLAPHGERFADLARITVPTLVTNGHTDVMLPTINSFYLQQHLPNAQLILFPDSGHAPHFQYPAQFVAHLDLFLA